MQEGPLLTIYDMLRDTEGGGCTESQGVTQIAGRGHRTVSRRSGLLKVADSQVLQVSRERLIKVGRLAPMVSRVVLQVGGLLPGGLRVRGISGGEKRRLSIACGIVGAPELIFLDEPTSGSAADAVSDLDDSDLSKRPSTLWIFAGLDTSSALTVMQCIRSLADEGRIVLSSIHQPRARIWELFDSVVVLAEGRTLYCGPTDGATAWFMGCQGISRQLQYIPELHGTVCEWVADMIAVPVEKKADEACGGGSLSSEVRPRAEMVQTLANPT